jgi:hypothetical protein
MLIDHPQNVADAFGIGHRVNHRISGPSLQRRRNGDQMAGKVAAID